MCFFVIPHRRINSKLSHKTRDSQVCLLIPISQIKLGQWKVALSSEICRDMYLLTKIDQSNQGDCSQWQITLSCLIIKTALEALRHQGIPQSNPYERHTDTCYILLRLKFFTSRIQCLWTVNVSKWCKNRVHWYWSEVMKLQQDL